MGTVVERDFRGEFETHLTVRPDDRTVSGAPLERWAGRHGLKLTCIVLDRGAVRDQPMLTERGRGTLAEQRAAARLRSAELRAAGFSVVRVKIEAAPSLFFGGNPRLQAWRESNPGPGGAERRSSLPVRRDGQVGRFWFSM